MRQCRGHQAVVVPGVAPAGRIDQHVGIVGAVGQVVDDEDAMRPAAAGALEAGIAAIVIDDEEIGRAVEPRGDGIRFLPGALRAQHQQAVGGAVRRGSVAGVSALTAKRHGPAPFAQGTGQTEAAHDVAAADGGRRIAAEHGAARRERRQSGS